MMNGDKRPRNGAGDELMTQCSVVECLTPWATATGTIAFLVLKRYKDKPNVYDLFYENMLIIN